jgi:phosphatidate cytidylyltransferase
VKSDLRLRFAVAGIGIPLCAIVALAGDLVFAMGLGVVASVATWELGEMFRARGARPFVTLGALGAFLLPPVVHYFGFTGGAYLSAFLLMLYAVVAMIRIPIKEGPISAAALTAFGALYVGGLLSFGIPLRNGWVFSSLTPLGDATVDRVAWTLFFFYPVVLTWVADTAAYFGGKTFGRHRMSPQISPNKTVEGAVAALVSGPIAAVAYALWVLPGRWTLAPQEAALLGVVVAGLGIFGDLVESAMKRECGVKDSSSLLPGHGGLLDRLDSILWALPAAYLFFALMG